VFSTVEAAKPGDAFDVKLEKDKNDYWQWVAISKAGSQPQSGGAVAVKEYKSQYETPEERARRQVLIVRQNALTNACNMAAVHKEKDIKAVLNMADALADWTLHGDAMKQVAEMENDVPF
jgi:hypothetical protein